MVRLSLKLLTEFQACIKRLNSPNWTSLTLDWIGYTPQTCSSRSRLSVISLETTSISQLRYQPNFHAKHPEMRCSMATRGGSRTQPCMTRCIATFRRRPCASHKSLCPRSCQSKHWPGMGPVRRSDTGAWSVTGLRRYLPAAGTTS